MFKKLFEPINIGNLELKNRLTTVAMEGVYCEQDGTVTDRHIAYVEARAKGGWGLIISEACSVSQQGTGFTYCTTLKDDKYIPGMKRVADIAHKHGAKMAVQLIHAGRQTSSALSGMDIVAPSAVKDPTEPEIPHEMSIAEIKQTIEDFGDAALRAKKAGFDAVEIHGAHGYLVQQFVSPFSNKRGDEYGGTIRNRARFALEIVENIKSKCGNDYPLLYRMTADELVVGGLTLSETKAIAMMLEDAGINAINVSLGNYTTSWYICPTAYSPKGFTGDMAEEIKKAVSIPVISVGRYVDPYVADAALLSGKADMIGMGRGSLADPEFPLKAKEGRIDDIIQCISCRQGCQGNLFKFQGVECLVNPVTGHEGEYIKVPADVKKKVAVIGGGVAGMEAAIVAAERGHSVTLYEKSDKLGGQWLLAAIPPAKHELGTLTWWQKCRLKKLGVKVLMNTEFTEEDIGKEKFDAAIVATGSIPFIPPIKGIESEKAVLASEVLGAKKDVGANIVVIGGGQVGCEVAAFLAQYFKKVTVLEMLEAAAKDGEPGANFFLFDDLKKNNVEISTSAAVKEIKDNSVIYEKDGKIHSIDNVDNFVIAVGSKANNAIAEKLKGKIPKVVVIGDAMTPGSAFQGMKQAYNAGYYI